MNNKNDMNDKFYDFIDMYNAIIKHCANKERHYDVKLFYVEGKLYFQVIDTDSKIVLHNCDIECSQDESKLIYNMITSEFILNHQLKYAAYVPMNSSDILEYRRLTKNKTNIQTERVYYTNNSKPMQIHALENTKFTLNIYQYNGIDEQTELLHKMAINKINNLNEQYVLKK